MADLWLGPTARQLMWALLQAIKASLARILPASFLASALLAGVGSPLVRFSFRE